MPTALSQSETREKCSQPIRKEGKLSHSSWVVGSQYQGQMTQPPQLYDLVLATVLLFGSSLVDLLPHRHPLFITVSLYRFGWQVLLLCSFLQLWHRHFRVQGCFCLWQGHFEAVHEIFVGSFLFLPHVHRISVITFWMLSSELENSLKKTK